MQSREEPLQVKAVSPIDRDLQALRVEVGQAQNLLLDLRGKVGSALVPISPDKPSVKMQEPALADYKRIEEPALADYKRKRAHPAQELLDGHTRYHARAHVNRGHPDRGRAMMRVFICSPYRGDIRANTRLAEMLCEAVAKLGHAPFAPHLHYTRFLDEHDGGQRETGMLCSQVWLGAADEVWYFQPYDSPLTSGMASELLMADKLGIPKRRIYNLSVGEMTLDMDARTV